MSIHQSISNDDLPWSVKLCFQGIAWSLLGLAIGGLATNIIDIFIPVRGIDIPSWLWPVLILIWTPGVVGILLGYYAIIRYPYLSLAMGWEPTLTSARWLWVMIGVVFWLVALLFTFGFLTASLSQPVDIWVLIACGYFAIECWFAGFLLIIFRADRHPTIATFILLTMGIGIAFFPIYLPAFFLGSIRSRSFLARIDSV